jgi:hypothetical protein
MLVEKRHRGTGLSAAQLANYTGAEEDLIGTISCGDNSSSHIVNHTNSVN